MMSKGQQAGVEGGLGPAPDRARRSRSSIGPATSADVPAIAALLREAELPHEDFAPHIAHFRVARDDRGNIIGTIGAEVHVPDALLRSLVVAPQSRGRGIGDQLLRDL